MPARPRRSASVRSDAVLVKVKDDEEAFVIKVLSSEPRVAYAEPNHIVSIAEMPTDPLFSQLWGLHNTGQTGGTNNKDIDAPEAWDFATGSSSIVVAVTDTGVDFTHPDLVNQRWVNSLDDAGDNNDDDANNLVDDWSGWDFVNDDNDPFDDNRHGTHVSGTIGAEANNGAGVVGVNWNVQIMALKFLSAAGSGTTADAIAATLYAADHGADVSSNSWGGGAYDQALLNAIEYGASRGMLFVAAAGNDSYNNDVTPTYPATYASDAIVAVAATDHNDGLAFFSSYGAKTVDLGAPGVGILSTTPGNTYGTFDGTSMATPHVAGAAALIKDKFPGATLYGIKALLMNSVDPAAALNGRTVTGGRLNIGTALKCDNKPKVVLSAPANGFVVGVGDVIPIKVLGANCAVPAGSGNVTATVNGTSVPLTAEPDSGLYTGLYTVPGPAALSVTATVTVGTFTASQTVNGNAYPNYTCQDASFSWVDVTGVSPLVGADGDDAFSTLNIGFPISFFGQTYSTAYVSSNGFLTLGSNAGANAPLNAAIPTTATPNGLIAPFWDDLYPGASGSVHAAVGGVSPNRTLYIEWFNVPHFNLSTSGTVTFEAIIKENGDIRYQYLDTSFEPAGNPAWNEGGSATAGVERSDGVVGRQISHNQPLLTNGKAVSCTFGTPPPPPPPPTITTNGLPGGTVGVAYDQTLAADDGTPPKVWSVALGLLPAGLSLNSSTGAITGTPTTPGTATFTARVTDGATPPRSDDQALSIAVGVAPLVIATTSLPVGTVGVAYSLTLAATGGVAPYTWTRILGKLPNGLALSPSGTISGTPSRRGTYTFTVRVGDSQDTQVSRTFTIQINRP